MSDITFFFDRNFGKQLPFALSKIRTPFNVKWHQGEGFPANLPDDDWPEKVGGKNWVVVTHDVKWQVESIHIQAIRDYKIPCFFLHGAQSIGWFKLKCFVQNLDRMKRVCATEQGGFIYKIAQNNRWSKVL